MQQMLLEYDRSSSRCGAMIQYTAKRGEVAEEWKLNVRSTKVQATR